MKPFVWLAFVSVLAAGCASGGSHTSSTPAMPVSSQGSGARMIPYALPFRTDAAVEAARESGRSTQNSVGNIPTVTAASVPITVGLVDAPLFGLTQVNLALQRINAIANLGTANQSEVPLAIYPGDATVDVLNYQTFAALVAATVIPSGHYDALELVCDPGASTVVTDGGRTLPIVFGNFANDAFAASTTGHYSIVIPYAFDATIGINSELIDFNVENSVNMQNAYAEVSASTFATAADSAGAIGGTLETAAGAPVQNATAVVTDANGAVRGLAPTDASGSFVVHALAPGTYTLTIDEKYLTAAGVTVSASDGKTRSLPPMTVTVTPGYEAFVGTLSD